jgi:NAD(P)H-quinone oxidoreductase subunit 4
LTQIYDSTTTQLTAHLREAVPTIAHRQMTSAIAINAPAIKTALK